MEMYRDFTFIDDIIEGINGCIYKPATIEENFDFQIPRLQNHLRLLNYLI